MMPRGACVLLPLTFLTAVLIQGCSSGGSSTSPSPKTIAQSQVTGELVIVFDHTKDQAGLPKSTPKVPALLVSQRRYGFDLGRPAGGDVTGGERHQRQDEGDAGIRNGIGRTHSHQHVPQQARDAECHEDA